MGSRHVAKRLSSGSFLVAAIFFAVTAAAQQTSTIGGVLHVVRGEFPAHKIEVLLETQATPVAQTYCDDEGRFTFYNLNPNVYHVVVQDPDYLNVDEIVEINPLMLQQTVNLSIYLTPRESSNPSLDEPARPAPDGRMMHASTTGSGAQAAQKGGNPYLVSPKELARNYPKDAVKEFEKAGESRRKGKLDDAIKHYEKAISIAPGFYAAHNDLGTAYLEKRDFTGAEQEFQGVLKSNPSDADAYFNLANAELLTGDLHEGLNYVQQGLSKQPNAPLGLFVQGSLYRRLGELQLAERSLHECLQADPTLANAHLELVNVYRQEDNRPAVISELQAFLKLYPKNPFVPQVKSTLDRLNAPAAPAPSLIH